ncbi:MAG: stage IV sporulation protein A [Clostridia bacterium]|nr:stage IV sporulation protein A [Clostridia bacterium]
MSNIYHDISTRTNGDIYIGVVGPVRTGKSTFIKRFMEELVLPNITDSFKKERAVDELPQSAAGKTIMTTEPKFIPDEAVKVIIDNNATMNVRMIDCVGYVVNSAMGHTENDSPRMVSTPWYDEEIPFVEAAEIGTKKVISEHSTIGLVVTTDGSITEIPREEYIEAEERVIKELKAINKPFLILLNSVNPDSNSTIELKNKLEAKYDSTVVAVNCQTLNEHDINSIIRSILHEFPIREIKLKLPGWIESLPDEHWFSAEITALIKNSLMNVNRIRDIKKIQNYIYDGENITDCKISSMDLGSGSAVVNISVKEELFYKILGERSGFEITGQESLISLITSLAEVKKEYDKVSFALSEVNRKGYGIVSPTIDELVLEEPQIVKQGGRYGVRLKASAPSIHIMCNKQRLLKTA